MVIENESIIRLYYENLLKNFCIKVLKGVSRGGDAIEKILTTKPSLVFMDIFLKDSVSGIDVVRTVREQNPALQVVYNSQYRSSNLLKKQRKPNPWVFFQSP